MAKLVRTHKALQKNLGISSTMKLTAFKIINCFGFQDSGFLDLKDEHDLIYLLGRNSSGKSSVLNAIKYFEINVKPSEQPNFKNFNDSGQTSALVAAFQVRESKLSADVFKNELIKKLNSLYIDEAARKNNPKLQKMFDTVLGIYSALIDRINKAEKVEIWKLYDGHYHYLEYGNDEYTERKKNIEAAIAAAKERDGNFNTSGSMRSIPITWNTFEDLLFLQSPNIYLFNEKFSLREVLPERIDVNWEKSNNNFLNTLVGYLGKEKVNRYLNPMTLRKEKSYYYS